MYYRWLFSQIRSVIIFSLHINLYNCHTQCTVTGCELNGNINVNVRRLLQCAVHTVQLLYCLEGESCLEGRRVQTCLL